MSGRHSRRAQSWVSEWSAVLVAGSLAVTALLVFLTVLVILLATTDPTTTTTTP